MSWQLGFDIWATIAKRDMLDKMQSDSAKPILSYVGWIAVDFMLLIVLFFVGPKEFFKQQIQQPRQLILLMAVVVPLVLFHYLVTNMLNTYCLYIP